MKKTMLIAVAFFGLAGLARADSFTVIGSRADQNPTDIIDWGQLGPAQTFGIGTPALVSTFDGTLALVGNATGGTFNRVDEGNGWTGNFDFGSTLVWTGNSNFPGIGGSGPFVIELATGVSSVGFDIQTDFGGAFLATVDIYDTSLNLMGTETFSGNSTNLENGSAQFVGIGDLRGVNIGAIVISTSNGPGNDVWANDFAIDDPSFTYGALSVPEPASILLLGSGLLGLAGIRRRKLSA